MKKKFIAVSVAALLSISLLGILVGCDGGGASTEPSAGTANIADIADIQAFNQDSNGITIVNYTVAFKQTTDEWVALSDEDRDRLALAGFSAAMEKVKEDSVSNYNIIGQTSPGTDDAGAAVSTQVVFVLDKEANTLKVFGADQQQTGEVAVDSVRE